MTEETNKYLDREGLGIFKDLLISYFKNNLLYTHPIYGARTGAGGDANPGFGESFKVSQISSDNLGHVTELVDRIITIPDNLVTTTKAGLMSPTDKIKLNALEWAEYD